MYKSTSATIHLFTERYVNFLEKIGENMLAGPSFVCTRQAAVDKTLVRDAIEKCQATDEYAASQLYPYYMCQFRYAY